MDTKDFLAESKFYESYSRFIQEENRFEDWEDAVSRVMGMHRGYYKQYLTPQLEELIEEAQQAYSDKRVLGAQRALQFGGKELLKHQIRMYNCCSTVVDRPEVFGEIFYTLLCGAGVGFAVYKKYVDKLATVLPRVKQAKVHVIEDSIEGWATAADVLLSSFFEGGGKHPEYFGRKIYFDFTKIRPKGAVISGGFKAPGPDPLRNALNKVENLLIAVGEQKRKLKPIEVYDIIMHMADAVISGGVRRSATICMFDIDDEEMINAKTGNWFIDNPQRARSNNSVAIIRKQATKEQFDYIYERNRQFGEPGFVFVEDDTITYNPCVSH